MELSSGIATLKDNLVTSEGIPKRKEKNKSDQEFDSSDEAFDVSFDLF